jgi:hypothetical protein
LVLSLNNISQSPDLVSTLALPGQEVALEVERPGGIALASLAPVGREAIVLRQAHLATLARHSRITVTYGFKRKP